MSVIVSLASHKKRLCTLALCLNTIFQQTVQPDKFILNLTKEDYLFLPDAIHTFLDKGLKINIVNQDLGPHNKYFETMKKHPDDIVITIDDDVLYPNDLIEKLLSSYERYPESVSTGRAHKILFDDAKNILPYHNWLRECDTYNIPDLTLFANGVGGVLYPPHCMADDLFNSELIKKMCLYADDIWLKAMQLLKKTPVVLIKQASQHPPIIPELMGEGLFVDNLIYGRNNQYLHAVFSYYSITYERIVKEK